MFTVPSANVTVQGYRNVKYRPSSTGITPISFSIPALGDFVDLNRSFLEVELKLNSASANGIVADANAASDANNTCFVYVTNNLGHMLCTDESTVQWHFDERTDRYVRLQCLLGNAAELQSRRRGDLAGASRLGELFECDNT